MLAAFPSALPNLVIAGIYALASLGVLFYITETLETHDANSRPFHTLWANIRRLVLRHGKHDHYSYSAFGRPSTRPFRGFTKSVSACLTTIIIFWAPSTLAISICRHFALRNPAKPHSHSGRFGLLKFSLHSLPTSSSLVTLAHLQTFGSFSQHTSYAYATTTSLVMALVDRRSWFIPCFSRGAHVSTCWCWFPYSNVCVSMAQRSFQHNSHSPGNPACVSAHVRPCAGAYPCGISLQSQWRQKWRQRWRRSTVSTLTGCDCSGADCAWSSKYRPHGVLQGFTLLINECVPAQSARGTINTAGTTVGNLSKCIYPPLAMILYGGGLDHGIVGLSFWVLSGLAIVAVLTSYLVNDGEHTRQATMKDGSV